MMNLVIHMLEYVVYFLQLLLFSGALFVSIRLLKKDRSYLANRFLAAALGLVSIYAVLLFLYKALNSAQLLQYSIRIGFSALILAVYFLFCTIQVLVHSSKVITTQQFKMAFWLMIALVISGLMLFSDWILVENDDITTLDYLPGVFYLFAAYIATMIIYSMVNLYLFGIRSTTSTSKRYIWLFFAGLGSMLCGLIVEGLGGAFEGLASLFDILLFLFLCIGVILMALSLLRKK